MKKKNFFQFVVSICLVLCMVFSILAVAGKSQVIGSNIEDKTSKSLPVTLNEGDNLNEFNVPLISKFNMSNVQSGTQDESLVTSSETTDGFLYGDVNGDGSFNSTDYSILKRYLLGIYVEFPLAETAPPDYDSEKAADVNGDGLINSTDYALFKRKLLGIIPVFPVEEMVTPTPTPSVRPSPEVTPVYTGSSTVNLNSGKTFDFAFKANNVKKSTVFRYKVTYNSSDLEVVDLCSETQTKELSAGRVEGTKVDIVEYSQVEGRVTFDVSIYNPPGKEWTGSVNTICFKSKATKQSNITYDIDEILVDFVQISCGYYHTAALKRDGTVWTWGQNTNGELGIGTKEDNFIPVQVQGLPENTSISSVYAGDGFTIAIDNSGYVWVWGRNMFGQLGDGTVPEKINDLAGIVSVSAIPGKIVALDKFGDVWIKTATEAYIKEGLSAVKAVFAQATKGYAVDNNGYVWEWEWNQTPGRISGLSNITAITGSITNNYSSLNSNLHVVALDKSGNVWAWGNNYFGQLGDGTFENKATPIKVPGLTNVISVAAGTIHTVAIDSEGNVWSWGANHYGALGDSTMTLKQLPTKIEGINDVVSISTSWKHTAAVTNDGSIWTWGAGDKMGVGDEVMNLIPTELNLMNDVIDSACGSRFTVALKQDGTVWTWGSNNSGHLGDGSVYLRKFSPVQVKALSDIIDVEAADHYTLVLKNDGTVWTWGINNLNYLGGMIAQPYINTPVEVNGLKNIKQIAAGESHIAALDQDGNVWTAGNNSFGQIGDKSTDSKDYPVKVLSNIKSIAAGNNHTIALDNNGKVWVWGHNYFGQLGDGSTVNQAEPKMITSSFMPVISEIFAGKNTTFALDSSGNIWACGDNRRNLISQDPLVLSATRPEKISGITNITRLSAQELYILALDQSGNVYAWGDNDYGSLGIGSNEDQPLPVKIDGFTDVKTIATGIFHASGVKNDGSIWTWGQNKEGELGIGYGGITLMPVKVEIAQ